MPSGFFGRWERTSRAMRRNSAPSRKCPKADRHQTWDLYSREMVGLGGLEPPTSPLSVLMSLVAECHSSRYRMRSGSTIQTDALASVAAARGRGASKEQQADLHRFILVTIVRAPND